MPLIVYVLKIAAYRRDCVSSRSFIHAFDSVADKRVIEIAPSDSKQMLVGILYAEVPLNPPMVGGCPEGLTALGRRVFAERAKTVRHTSPSGIRSCRLGIKPYRFNVSLQ